MIIKNGKRMDGCSDTVPIGSIYPYLGTTPPFGYLILDGSMVSKSIYPELYSICGTIYGAETLETFKLPDLRGVTVAGYKENDLVFGTLGGLAGSLTHQHSTSEHTLTIDEIPSHSHDLYGALTGETKAITNTGNDWAQTTTGFSTGTYIKNTGGGQAHTHGDTGSASSVQPTITLNWIVKAIKMIPNMSSVQSSYQTSSTNTYSCSYINSVVGASGDALPVGTELDFDGQSSAIPVGWEQVDDPEDYSSSEIKTNKNWIDGKPIYKKTVAISFPTSSTSSSTYHNISNISMLIFAYIVWYDTVDNKWFINFKDTTGTYYVELDGISPTTISVKSGTNYNWNDRTKDRYAILYYTKTTD